MSSRVVNVSTYRYTIDGMLQEKTTNTTQFVDGIDPQTQEWHDWDWWLMDDCYKKFYPPSSATTPEEIVKYYDPDSGKAVLGANKPLGYIIGGLREAFNEFVETRYPSPTNSPIFPPATTPPTLYQMSEFDNASIYIVPDVIKS